MFLYAASAQANAQSALAGTVKDQNGDVVSGATVTLRGTHSHAGLTTTTDRDGEFSFKGIPAGDYQLRTGIAAR